jgi:transposase
MKMGTEWWIVKELFKKHGIERISLTERAMKKRARDFDLIYKLHFEEEIGLNNVLKKYRNSPTYIKAVLEDKGVAL